jgi:hypothetical protein
MLERGRRFPGDARALTPAMIHSIYPLPPQQAQWLQSNSMIIAETKVHPEARKHIPPIILLAQNEKKSVGVKAQTGQKMSSTVRST